MAAIIFMYSGDIPDEISNTVNLVVRLAVFAYSVALALTALMYQFDKNVKHMENKKDKKEEKKEEKENDK